MKLFKLRIIQDDKGTDRIRKVGTGKPVYVLKGNDQFTTDRYKGNNNILRVFEDYASAREAFREEVINIYCLMMDEGDDYADTDNFRNIKEEDLFKENITDDDYGWVFNEEPGESAEWTLTLDGTDDPEEIVLFLPYFRIVKVRMG